MSFWFYGQGRGKRRSVLVIFNVLPIVLFLIPLTLWLLSYLVK